MSSLYELTGDYLLLKQMLEDEDADEQAVKDTLESIDSEIEIKADNYAKIIQEFEGVVEMLANEQKRLQARKTKLQNSIEKLKSDLTAAMISTGKKKFKTDLFSFNIQKNGGQLPVIVDVDTSMLPDDYVIISEKPDLKAIGTYLQTHPECKWAHYGERGESLRIK